MARAYADTTGNRRANVVAVVVVLVISAIVVVRVSALAEIAAAPQAAPAQALPPQATTPPGEAPQRLLPAVPVTTSGAHEWLHTQPDGSPVTLPAALRR